MGVYRGTANTLRVKAYRGTFRAQSQYFEQSPFLWFVSATTGVTEVGYISLPTLAYSATPRAISIHLLCIPSVSKYTDK